MRSLLSIFVCLIVLCLTCGAQAGERKSKRNNCTECEAAAAFTWHTSLRSKKCPCGADCKCEAGACESGKCSNPLPAPPTTTVTAKVETTAASCANGQCSNGQCSSGRRRGR